MKKNESGNYTLILVFVFVPHLILKILVTKVQEAGSRVAVHHLPDLPKGKCLHRRYLEVNL